MRLHPEQHGPRSLTRVLQIEQGSRVQRITPMRAVEITKIKIVMRCSRGIRVTMTNELIINDPA